MNPDGTPIKPSQTEFAYVHTPGGATYADPPAYGAPAYATPASGAPVYGAPVATAYPAASGTGTGNPSAVAYAIPVGGSYIPVAQATPAIAVGIPVQQQQQQQAPRPQQNNMVFVGGACTLVCLIITIALLASGYPKINLLINAFSQVHAVFDEHNCTIGKVNSRVKEQPCTERYTLDVTIDTIPERALTNVNVDVDWNIVEGAGYSDTTYCSSSSDFDTKSFEYGTFGLGLSQFCWVPKTSKVGSSELFAFKCQNNDCLYISPMDPLQELVSIQAIYNGFLGTILVVLGYIALGCMACGVCGTIAVWASTRR